MVSHVPFLHHQRFGMRLILLCAALAAACCQPSSRGAVQPTMCLFCYARPLRAVPAFELHNMIA
jgi:hypothetical protein